jgi:hypothetical protein
MVVAGDASAVVGADCSATAGVADLLDSDMLKSFQLRERMDQKARICLYPSWPGSKQGRVRGETEVN